VKTFRLHPQAKADLLSGAEYYERASWAVAGRYAVEMNRLVQEVCASPGAFRIFWAPARRHFGARFPYAVIYVEEADHVLVLAFAHFKRRPGYWSDRRLRGRG
jgi:plasmid stabilization system protein ParE